MTNSVPRPEKRPRNPNFSSGPTSKRPGWTLQNLESALLGRSHRSGPAKARLLSAIERSREILGIPADFRIAVVAGSDTGAIEMALWSLLGARGVDVLAWEVFGLDWLNDIVKQLRLDDVREFTAPFGEIPDLDAIDSDRDIVFAWNGTTSGVCVPNGDWISADRQGLTICDATSAIFAMDLPWEKLDVTTYSWQKALGGEAAHGMLILSPRAVERLETYTPPWPLPKLFRMTKSGKLIEGLFRGETINTPSLLCLEDYHDSLDWIEEIGGQSAARARSQANLAALESWMETCDWAAFMAASEFRSSTSVCIEISDSWFTEQASDRKQALLKELGALLEVDGIAYDIVGHKSAPPGLRIWAGPTVEQADIEALLPWLDWAYSEVKCTHTAD